MGTKWKEKRAKREKKRQKDKEASSYIIFMTRWFFASKRAGSRGGRWEGRGKEDAGKNGGRRWTRKKDEEEGGV